MTDSSKKLIHLEKIPNLKDMTREQRREWAHNLHAVITAKILAQQDQVSPAAQAECEDSDKEADDSE
jgi:hypothetical protein